MKHIYFILFSINNKYVKLFYILNCFLILHTTQLQSQSIGQYQTGINNISNHAKIISITGGGYAACENFIISGQGCVGVTIFNSNFQPINSKYYVDPNGYSNNSTGGFVQTSDGGFILAGRSQRNYVDGNGNSAFDQSPFIMKVDASLNLQWKNYGTIWDEGGDLEFWNVLISGTNVQTVGDVAFSSGAGGGNMSEFDIASGALVRSNIYKTIYNFGPDPDGNQQILELNTEYNDIIRTSDGNNLMVGTEYAINYEFFVTKTDPIGNIIWSNTIKFPGSGSSSEGLLGAAEGTGGSYYISGHTTAPGAPHGVIGKVSSSGSLLWLKNIGPITFIAGGIVASSSGNGCIAHFYSNQGAAGPDLTAIKLDDNGNTVWTKSYGTLTSENSAYGSNIAVLADGTYSISGYFGNSGGYIVKFRDSDGKSSNVLNCAFERTATFSNSSIGAYMDPAPTSIIQTTTFDLATVNISTPTVNNIPLCVCLGGATAPAVTPTTANNTCPSTIVNLGSLAVSSSTPSGTTLVWSLHNPPTSAGDTLTAVQKAALGVSGKYYAFYFDGLNVCYSPADSVVVTINSCPENCSNGIDDDGDGLVDCEDPDCAQMQYMNLTSSNGTNSVSGTITAGNTFTISHSGIPQPGLSMFLQQGGAITGTLINETGNMFNCPEFVSVGPNRDQILVGVGDPPAVDGAITISLSQPVNVIDIFVRNLDVSTLIFPSNVNIAKLSGNSVLTVNNTTKIVSNGNPATYSNEAPPYDCSFIPGSASASGVIRVTGNNISSLVIQNPKAIPGSGTFDGYWLGISLQSAFCPEICNNGIDDDGDGLIDCADITDCKPNAGIDKSVCIGDSVQMSATGTGTWSIGAGSAGTATIVNSTSPTTYVKNYSASGIYRLIWSNGGCTDTALINVHSLPTLGGATSVCVGSTATVSPTTGGTWTSSNTGVATVTYAGVVTGVSAGTVTLTFTDNNTCVNTKTFTVNPLPVLGGATSVCVGSTATVSPTTGGTWTSSNTGIATVTNAGVVTGVSAGTVTLTFTDNNNCFNTKTFTVNPLPVLGGATSVCVGTTATVTPTTGGTWTSSNTGVATVTNAGVVTGVSDGSVTLTFTETSTGCSQTKSISSNMVDAGTDKTGCQFGNVTMSGSGNGSWSIGAGSAGSASISDPANPTSTVSGFSLPGIYYLIRNNNGCVDTALVTINAQPSVNASQTTVCPGNSVNLVGTNPNTGIWTAQSGNPSGATLGSTSSGIANVTFSNSIPTPSNFYFIYTANGCSASQQIQVISCNQPPVITDTTVVTAVNTAITVCRSITDPDAGQSHSVTLCGGPNHGNITSGPTVNNASSPHQICLTYNPVINYTGLDTICIITCDNGTPVLCDTAKIYINIACPVQPTVDANPDSLTICTNEAVVINFTPTPSNATVYWYNNLGAYGLGNITGIYLTNTGTLDSIVHFYAYSTTHNGGCISDTIHIPVRVKPLPIVTTSFCIDTVCPNELLFCQFFSSLNGTTFTWTNNFGQTGTGNSISQTFQNITNSIIHYVYTVNATSNGCTVNNAKQIDIYVLPSSTVIASPTVDTICAGQSANIQLSGATSYSWQGDLFPMHTTGTGPIINSTLRNDGIQPYTVDYNIQAVSNGCLGTSTASVVVLPNILLNPSLTSLTICSGNRAEIIITSVPSSLPISWTTNTGFSGNGNVNMFLTNNGNTPVTHQFTFTTNWNGCTQQITIPVVVTP